MTDTLITTAAIIMTGTTIGTETSQAGMTPSRGGHSLPTRCCRGASEREVMPQSERCNQCDQALIKIDNRGEQLVGCLTCNLWAPPSASVGSDLARKTFGRCISYVTADCADLWPAGPKPGA